MSAHTVQLSEEQEQFICEGVRSGRFADEGDAIANGLRMLQTQDAEHRAKLQYLRQACDEASASLDRGEGIDYDTPESFSTWMQDTVDEVCAEHAARR